MIDLSYQVRDFILFSRDTFAEILIGYNQTLWPWQILILILSLVLIPVSHKSTRIASLMLAGFWILGAVFHGVSFQEINWAAKYFSWIFILQALLIVYLGVVKNDFPFGGSSRIFTWLGRILFFVAVLVPFNLWVTRDPRSLMLLGWGPDAMALGTIGLVMLGRGSIRWLLAVIPALWLLTAGLIYYGLK